MNDKFITLEGSEGSGKSTQAELLCRYLRKKRISFLHLREPGGAKISEAIRKILLDVKNIEMAKSCEVLLYIAARAQLVQQLILPALRKGKIVICDRFMDSTVAYQGFGCGVSVKSINEIGIFATQGLKPDLTLIFDIPTREGLKRAGKNKDRIERRSLDYHRRVRRGYLTLAKKEPRRIKVIKVDGDKGKIERIVRGYVDKLLKI